MAKKKKYYPSSRKAVKKSVGKGKSKPTQKLFRKLGKVGNKTPYAKKYKKRK